MTTEAGDDLDGLGFSGKSKLDRFRGLLEILDPPGIVMGHRLKHSNAFNHIPFHRQVGHRHHRHSHGESQPVPIPHPADPPPVVPLWPTFTGTATPIGMSPGGAVYVYVDATLGQSVVANATDLLADADRVVGMNEAIFGDAAGFLNVLILAIDGMTDGTGGADHAACNYTTGGDIEVCAAFGNPARVSALFEAELSECSMGGHLCGLSTGESLSRWCAMVVGNNALADFATIPAWVADDMPDFVNVTHPTDQDNISIGCGMAFLSWLQSLGYPLTRIAPAMVALGDTGTLAQLYASLAGDDEAVARDKFMAAIRTLRGTLITDDPFGP